ncbi:MAG TPA: hypothetical protein VGF53_16665 [Pseudolabrys sp.]|jgi:hypothetical protein
MGRGRTEQAVRGGAGKLAPIVLALALGGCGTAGDLLKSSPLDYFSSSSKATNDVRAAGGSGPAASDDIDCPEIRIRTGASTLMIGSKPGVEPSALELRYQGSIIRTARECHVNAGIMSMKVGIEGRVITGPAGGPGTVDVPLRIAIVQEGVTPKAIASRFGRETATLDGSVDRVIFTHIESDITFPLPQPLAQLDAYVVYVGFDPLGAQPEKKKPPVKRKPAAKPKQS